MFKKSADRVKQRVKEYLERNCIGACNSKTAAQIVFLLKLKDKRSFRLAIHELRVEGFPVLSSSSQGGYYLPNSPEEIAEGLEEFTSRIISLKAAAKGIRQGLEKRFPGSQIKLDIGA